MFKIIGGTCKTCRWWEWHGLNEGFCRTDPDKEYISKIPVRDGRPSVWAKHDVVRTRPDFGCVEWERKILNEKETVGF